MKKNLHYIVFLLYLFLSFQSIAQNGSATLKGKVIDENGQPIDLVNVALSGYPIGTSTNHKGEYLLRIPAGREFTVAFSALGYEIAEIVLNLEVEEFVEKDVVLKAKSEQIGDVVILEQTQASGNVVRIDAKQIDAVAAPGIGTVESILKTLPGVSSTNEMSSQYSVRGGSFDENLVYVNGIEVYRPYLVRSGQQEGLSFVNTDLVSSIEFSAGGFDAKYGDKMSSVLDITYNKPTKFGASASVSFLGGKAHVENVSKSGKFTYNMGGRYKSFKYLLGTLDEDATYDPHFFDFQGYFIYSFSDKLELSFLGTVSSNTYNYYPRATKTSTGTWNNQISLNIDFQGQEKDSYKTYTGAFSLNYKPVQNAYLKFNASAYHTNEAETYDILAYYLLNEVLGEGTAEQDDSSMNIGLGMFQTHARDYFDATVVCFDHTGGVKSGDNMLQWGVNAKCEYVADKMHEWEYRDSAGYSLPYSDNLVQLYSVAKNDYELQEYRFTGFIQDSYSFMTQKGRDVLLTGGVRMHYWTFTDNISVSPRFSLSVKSAGERDIITRFSLGVYHQPPFYREIKDFYGNINYDIQTPRSINAVAGMDYSFLGWDRPFKLTADAYYKKLENLIPYQVENVRVRYLADEISQGYAYGVDFKVNGEFVSGTQSWISLSLLSTKEDIADDYDDDGNEIGYIRRPGDQRLKVSMYFQDYLPGMPYYQMHLTGHYITGAPFYLPNRPRTDKYIFHMSDYKRVDIGLMRLLVSENKNLTGWRFLDNFQDCSVSFEVFNIMDIDNVSSYYWITDVENNIYPIPNHLTGITLNLKVAATLKSF